MKKKCDSTVGRKEKGIINCVWKNRGGSSVGNVMTIFSDTLRNVKIICLQRVTGEPL